jgi:hypothetical protein
LSVLSILAIVLSVLSILAIVLSVLSILAIVLSVLLYLRLLITLSLLIFFMESSYCVMSLWSLIKSFHWFCNMFVVL